MPSCLLYGVRARGSERSRHMHGGAVQRSPEKVAVLETPAKAFLIVGRGVAARARALTTVLTFLSICHPRLQGSPRGG